ncbi:MAG TPA: hypothetical protein VL404_08330, partial [Candidatus Eisenbacteria bacterium]|nr:hypothetical protein [Candidatus Eisenbacteria bacterium]
QKKLLTQEQLEKALEAQKITKDFLGALLVRYRLISEEDLLKVLSEQFNIPAMQLQWQAIDWQLAMRYTPSVVVDHMILPVQQKGQTITVALVNPLDAEGMSRIEDQSKGFMVIPVLVTMSEMKRALKTFNEHMALKIKKMLE